MSDRSESVQPSILRKKAFRKTNIHRFVTNLWYVENSKGKREENREDFICIKLWETLLFIEPNYLINL